MKQSNNFPQQTHFIGVLASEDITATLEDCRRYMNEAYGCRSGHSTPIHVTLVPPFRLPQEYSTEDLALAIEKEVLPKGLGFTANVNNFDAFGDRTIFAKVEPQSLLPKNWYGNSSNLKSITTLLNLSITPHLPLCFADM